MGSKMIGNRCANSQHQRIGLLNWGEERCVRPSSRARYFLLFCKDLCKHPVDVILITVSFGRGLRGKSVADFFIAMVGGAHGMGVCHDIKITPKGAIYRCLRDFMGGHPAGLDLCLSLGGTRSRI